MRWAMAVLALVLFAGCTGGGGGTAAGAAEKVAERVGEEAAPAEGWCVEGSYWSWMNPVTGESAKLAIKGVVDHEDRSTCKAVLEGKAAGKYARWEGYFTRDGGYTHMLFYDGQNRLRAEWKMEGGKFSFREYDEQGNVVNEFSMGEGGMPVPGMPQMPAMPGQ